PHRSVQDDVYEGHFIPKGTIVIANIWELNREPELFGTDVNRFNPARYLDEKGALKADFAEAKDEYHFTFGFGRRSCVGKHVAVNTLFIEIATCLWACSISNVKGQKFNVDGFFEAGLTLRPEPFEVDVQERFPDALALLSQECELRGV
ncbi:unnamed protein product, partial [Peniophora sp. CBMAI 1063]